MATINILYFAHLKERTGLSREELEIPAGMTVAGLKIRLVEQHPGLEPAMPTVIVSINQEFAQDEDPVPAGAEVGLFPPVSGGDGRDRITVIRLTNDVLDLGDLVAQITRETTGAAAIFTGMVRGQTVRGDPHQTVSLEYEAYAPMAEAKMRQVADEIYQRWPSVEGIAIVQRLGHLEAGTPTVLIACSAAHRDTGVFEAARYGIDRLKEIVPVWKKEIGPNGEAWVEGDYHPQRGD